MILEDAERSLNEAHHHIGRWRHEAASCMSEMRDPADDRRVVTTVPAADANIVAEALNTALAGAQTWCQTPPPERSAVLRRFSDIVSDRTESIARSITAEMGKPIREARAEVGRAVDHARYFAAASREVAGKTVQLSSPSEIGYTVRAPLGVVAAITPWNFPIMIPNWKISAALAYGNSVIFKPADHASLSAMAIVECYLEAGLPPEVLSLVYGDGETVGTQLVASPTVDGITFTGSTAVGLHIAGEAASRGKRVQAEMGGKNALVILDDADLDAAVSAAVAGGFGTSGQRCTSSSRILVHHRIADEAIEKLVAATQRLQVGPGSSPQTDVGPLISAAALNNVLDAVDRAQADGAHLAYGGRRLHDGVHKHGHFLQPTVLISEPKGSLFEEEIFGPVISVHEVASLDESIELNNQVRYGLSAAIFTQDLSSAHRFINETDTGMVHVNRPTTGAEEHLPFGGIKNSGFGPAELAGAAEFFTNTRSAHLRWAQ
jgi:acyl-CoA reductase-like NAD-dependent aldehyde dehydrogenase